MAAPRPGTILIAGLVLALIVLHQDVWFWNDKTLVFGIVPIGLFYHVCLSFAAAFVWWLATVIAWPLDDDDDAAAVAVKSPQPPAASVAKEEVHA